MWKDYSIPEDHDKYIELDSQDPNYEGYYHILLNSDEVYNNNLSDDYPSRQILISRISSVQEIYENSYAKWDRSIFKRRRYSFF